MVKLIEKQTAKHRNDAWLSLVERCVRDAEVAGSNPVASMKADAVRHPLFLIIQTAALLQTAPKSMVIFKLYFGRWEN